MNVTSLVIVGVFCIISPQFWGQKNHPKSGENHHLEKVPFAKMFRPTALRSMQCNWNIFSQHLQKTTILEETRLWEEVVWYLGSSKTRFSIGWVSGYLGGSFGVSSYDLFWKKIQATPISINIWVFPKIVVPQNHPFSIGVFHYFHHPFWGTTIFGNTHIWLVHVLSVDIKLLTESKPHECEEHLIMKITFSSLIGWTNPFEKYAFLVRMGENLNPNFRGEHSKNIWVATTQFIGMP